MSKYSLEYLRNNVIIGFTEKHGQAWHASHTIDETLPFNHYAGAVPLKVAREFFSWSPVKVELYDSFGAPLKDHRDKAPVAITRSDNGTLLGITSERYPDTGYQERLLDGLESILDDTLDLKIGSLATWDGGSRAMVQIETPENLTHSSGEEVRPWLAAFSSLDGSTPTFFKEGTTRIQCDNTATIFLGEAGRKYSYRNVGSNGLVVANAREALDLLEKNADLYWAELDRMLATPVTESQFEDVLSIVIPGSESAGARARAENKRIQISDVYYLDDRVSAFAGNKWGAFQAFTTYYQHESNVRDGDNLHERNIRKLADGDNDRFSARVMGALDTVLA